LDAQEKSQLYAKGKPRGRTLAHDVRAISRYFAPMSAPKSDGATTAPTPMMAQYHALKAEAGDSMLFYRMGDFFELFFDDARAAAATLDIALTARGEHGGVPIPMCGVPVHAAEGYLARLIKAGHRVAIAEQTESPEAARRAAPRRWSTARSSASSPPAR
jgi:hypothetical protein